MPGTRLGRYEILSQIGAGGMGEVYLAFDTELDRKVAIKTLPQSLAWDQQRLRRFIQEAKAASALNHPHILTIYEIGTSGRSPFIATEFIDGDTLRQRIQEPLKLVDILEFSIQICSALTAAHAAGIIHRDIKPENIMIRRDGYVKLLDFGLAKLTESDASAADTETKTKALVNTGAGTVMGSANYMSPEQAKGTKLDARTDLWSLGAVLYEMVTGHVPFADETPAETISLILRKEPAPLTRYAHYVPAELERMVAKALTKNREERYQTAKDLLIDLRNLKRKLEVDAEINRTVPAEFRAVGSTSASSGQSTRSISSGFVEASIAVLPFVNMSADSENEYFCDGLAEELINSLSKIEDLKVAARTSAFSFKGKDVKLSEIGPALNVATVLEGSVRKVGTRLRITAQLIKVADGYHLWSERYDREMKDVFEIQDEISLAIVQALKLKLLGPEKAELLKRYTENTEAYHLYLKGRYYWNKRTELKKGIEYFQAAIDLEPNYALAYIGLADSYNLLSGHSGLPPKENFPKAKAAAVKALEIDAKLAEAHASLGFVIYRFDWNWQGAEQEFRRALEMNPSYATGYHWYGEFLALMGRFDESIAEMKRAQELDPLSLPINTDLGQSFFFARQYDQAKEQLRKTLEIDPNFVRARVLLGESFEQMASYEQAEAELQKAIDLSGAKTMTLAALGHLYGVSGKEAAAQKMLDEMLELAQEDYVSPYDIAVIYTGLGDSDQAFAWLEKAYEDRSVWSVWLKVDPRLDSLRCDSRFRGLLNELNLAP